MKEEKDVYGVGRREGEGEDKATVVYNLSL